MKRQTLTHKVSIFINYHTKNTYFFPLFYFSFFLLFKALSNFHLPKRYKTHCFKCVPCGVFLLNFFIKQLKNQVNLNFISQFRVYVLVIIVDEQQNCHKQVHQIQEEHPISPHLFIYKSNMYQVIFFIHFLLSLIYPFEMLLSFLISNEHLTYLQQHCFIFCCLLHGHIPISFFLNLTLLSFLI